MHNIWCELKEVVYCYDAMFSRFGEQVSEYRNVRERGVDWIRAMCARACGVVRVDGVVYRVETTGVCRLVLWIVYQRVGILNGSFEYRVAECRYVG